MDETFHSSSLVIPYLDTRSMSVKFIRKALTPASILTTENFHIFCTGR